MGEKNGDKKPADGGDKKAAAEGDKKQEGGVTAVFKLDLHCDGCAKKVKRAVSHFEGVEKVKVDCSANKLTVTGNVDPSWVRERVELKTKKKVELISPQPKKDAAAADNKSAVKKSTQEADDKKKPKEAAVSTVVMKVRLHCDGCAHKVKRAVLKNVDGVTSVKTDSQKDLVTVTGTMDVKELATYLQEKLKKGIEIIPPKKDDAGEKKVEKAGDGGGGGDKKDAPAVAAPAAAPAAKESKPAAVVGGGEGSKGTIGEVKKVEVVNKLEYNSLNPQTYFAMPIYNQSYANQDYGLEVHHPQGYGNYGYPQTGYAVQYSQAPPPPPPTYLYSNDQMFSDENPNGCSVM